MIKLEIKYFSFFFLRAINSICGIQVMGIKTSDFKDRF